MKTIKALASSAVTLALFAGNPLAAQEVQAEVEVSGGSPAMWKVADEDTTIYLFGTIHKLPEDIDWNTGTVHTALVTADELVTEIDMTPESIGTIAKTMLAKGVLPKGTTVRSLMTDDQRTVYEGGLAKLDLKPESFDRYEPWLAALQIAQTSTVKGGYGTGRGVEVVLESLVAADTKRSALETVDEQLAIFDELPMDDQIAFLLEGAEDPMKSVMALDKLVSLWASGKPEELGAAMNEALMAHPIIAERMLWDRNVDWADWIVTRLDEPGTVFMAVGAGHLAGDKSVQANLAERGIASTRVQ